MFLKAKNSIEGRYFAEILTEVAHRAASGVSTTAMEPRLSVYGQDKAEWSQLAKWWQQNGLGNLPNMKWMVQFPRLYNLFRRTDAVKSFDEYLRNCTSYALR